MKEKVEIVIEPNHHYVKSHKNGAEFTSVSFNARRYGSASPCDNNQEIEDCIKHQSEWIKREGDIPIIKDLRIKQTTLW